MRYTLLILAVVAAAYVVYEFVRIGRLVRISSNLVSEARGFERSDGTFSMLVLGDSTAVGVGALSHTTVAGRLAIALDASVENYAKSGARTRDIKEQFREAQKPHYDLILIQIGANDVIRLASAEKTGETLDAALGDIAKKSDHVVLLTAGKIGDAPFFPRLFSGVWTHRAGALRERFKSIVEEYDGVYVDLFAKEDVFSSDPSRYYAPDGLHLTPDGYGFWYEKTEEAIREKWPELFAYAD